jgi:hypothetical protein
MIDRSEQGVNCVNKTSWPDLMQHPTVRSEGQETTRILIQTSGCPGPDRTRHVPKSQTAWSVAKCCSDLK